MAGEGNYHKVLADNKRRLKDYQEVHFRRSTITEGTLKDRLNTPLPRFSLLSTSASSVGTGITLAPRRTCRALAQPGAEFNPSTASFYLRRTEDLWLRPNLSRQEATKTLFDRPIGTFVVRNSQKARYALSVRLPTDDPAVSHYLVEPNQQGFLTIQGSNLPFLSLYDLLAYFCFNKSGGMPCYLAKPLPDSGSTPEPLDQDSSDWSESDDDANEDEYHSPVYDLLLSPSPPRTSPPPLVPPHQVTRSAPIPIHPQRRQYSKSFNLHPVQEETFIHTQKQSDYVRNTKQRFDQSSNSHSRSFSPTPSPPPPQRVKRPPPPPKPPRGSMLIEEEDVFPPEEAHKVIRKVDSIVDMDAKNLYQSYRKITLTKRGGEEGGGDVGKEGRGRTSLSPLQQRRPLRRQLSWSSDDVRENKRHVNSLVELFEKGVASALTRGSPPPGPFRHRIPAPARGNSTPILPPRPARPPLPPRIVASASDEPPSVPPHTPAPLVPPRPVGSKAPFVPSRDRAASDSTLKSRPPAPPPGDVALLPTVPPRMNNESHYEFDVELRERLAAARQRAAEAEREGGGGGGDDEEQRAWATASADPVLERRLNGISSNSTTTTAAENERELSGSTEGSVKGRWKKWPKKLPKFYRKPRKKIRKFIIDLASDNSQEFGQMVGEFTSNVKANSKDPYQNMLSEIRTFLTQMHDYLLQHHHTDLLNCGMEACNNFEHVVETSLQQCILSPLSLYVYLRIEEHLMENSSLFQVQRSVHQGKHKTPQEMGIRENITVPGDKVVSEITAIFNRMTKTYCAISKLELLLEAVRLTYENIRDSKNPKKAMNDLGADDFLPLFVWVLVQSGFTRAEIEAEYMWGLAHPSLFNGEAGYYLTTLTSAVNVLKETQPAMPAFPQDSGGDNIEEQIQKLPCMNNLQTELKIFFEDSSTGQYSSAYRLAVVPDMTVAEVCDVIAKKHYKTNPASYGLFTVIDGRASEMSTDERPQEVKKRWALERTITGKTLQRKPSRFIAYRLKTPKQ